MISERNNKQILRLKSRIEYIFFKKNQKDGFQCNFIETYDTYIIRRCDSIYKWLSQNKRHF